MRCRLRLLSFQLILNCWLSRAGLKCSSAASTWTVRTLKLKTHGVSNRQPFLAGRSLRTGSDM